jgi:DNA (cytosine-5)-methyltransferase 1
MKLKILDLFSGLGGFSLGLERTGQFKTVAFCDNDKFSTLVLQKHWKGVKIYNDVKEIKKERLEADGIPSPDVITGGFPCQPFSVAGKQKGTDDNRHLWPEMFRIIQEFTPRWVIGENVKGLTNIQDGVVFETVCTDLEGEGYEVRTFNIPAAGVGAPHRRERIWIVAHRKESMVNPDDLRFEQHKEAEEETSWWRTSTTFEPTSNVVNPDNDGSPATTQRRSFEETGNHNEEGQNKTRESEGTSGRERYENLEDANDNGLEGRLTETRNQVSAGKEPTIHGSTNTNISSRRSDGRRDNEQSRVDGEVQGLRNGNEKESTRATGIRGLHERTDISQGVAREDRNQEDNSRTLVQEGQSRIQSSIDRGLEQDQTASKDNQIRQRDDSTSLNRMETRRDEDVEDSRRTLRQGTELRETNEDEIRKEDAHQHQRSSGSSESDVANTEQSRSSSESIGDFGSMEEKISREEEGRNQSSVRTSTRSTDVANANSGRSHEPNNEIQTGRNIPSSSSEDVADTSVQGLEGSLNEKLSTPERSQDVAYTERRNWNDDETVAGYGEFKTQEVFGDGDGIPGESAWWDVEPNVGRVAHGIPGRVYRLKGLGNSIIPQIAQEIGNAIITAEIEEKKKGCPHN